MKPYRVSVILPVIIKERWQKHMTDCCIKTMRDTTKIPYELVLVESESEVYKDNHFGLCDTYIHFPKRQGYSKEFNQAIELSQGEFVAQMGNDIFTRSGWLEALLECFEIPDCGAASIGSAGNKHPQMDKIVEAFWCPLMMWRKEWRFDAEVFPNVFGDSDLLMRMYKKGLRSYRNHKVIAQNLSQQSNGGFNSDKEREEAFNVAKKGFVERHQDSPLIMYKILSEGWAV